MCSYLNDVRRMIDFATALGNTTGVAFYTSQLAALTTEYNTAWFHAGTNIYGNTNGDGLQSSHAASLGINVVPAANKAAVQVCVCVLHVCGSVAFWRALR